MKKIFKQLCKLFPNTYVTLENILRQHSTGIPSATIYKVYISNTSIWSNNWSPEFNTLKELDKHLWREIKEYKKIYYR